MHYYSVRVSDNYRKPLSNKDLIVRSLVCATRRLISDPFLMSTMVDLRDTFLLVVTACEANVSQSMRKNVMDLLYWG